mgnify:CR=1 FL=1
MVPDSNNADKKGYGQILSYHIFHVHVLGYGLLQGLSVLLGSMVLLNNRENFIFVRYGLEK